MTDDALEQMATLAGALPFLKRYDDRIIVVKYGGHAMGEEETALRFGRDIALLEQVGVKPVVAHGGGLTLVPSERGACFRLRRRSRR